MRSPRALDFVESSETFLMCPVFAFLFGVICVLVAIVTGGQ